MCVRHYWVLIALRRLTCGLLSLRSLAQSAQHPCLCYYHRRTCAQPTGLSGCQGLADVCPGWTLELLLWVTPFQSLWLLLQEEGLFCVIACTPILSLALSSAASDKPPWIQPGPCGSCPSPSLTLSDPVQLCPLSGEAALACAVITLGSWLISALGAAHLLLLS